MKGELASCSIEFSLKIVSYYRWLTETKHEYVMARQILRSGTSIGANIHEAEYAASKADFINKIQIAAKEANETEYWLIILERSGFFDEIYSELKPLLKSLIRMLTATLNTAKNGKLKE